MASTGFSVVTGAFGHTGRYIARLLLSTGKPVKTLTGHPSRPNPLGQQVEVAPFNFDNPRELVGSLEGADVLYNTYWIRFSRGRLTFDTTVENTRTLIRAAEEAGVPRIVHVSITNASADSRLPYFKGKGLAEEAVKNSRLSYAIVRPALIFGKDDILINNIAWFLRRSPVFTVFGTGDYMVQPVYAEDMAQIAVDAGQGGDNVTIDAVGPETFSFEELVRLISRNVGGRVWIVHMRPGLGLFLSRMVGLLLRDVVLTREEMDGLMANLLVSEDPPTGRTLLSEWIERNADTVGATYASELSRHYR